MAHNLLNAAGLVVLVVVLRYLPTYVRRCLTKGGYLR